MRKGQSKVKICVSIDKELYSKIKDYCDKNMIKISTYINHKLKKWEK